VLPGPDPEIFDSKFNSRKNSDVDPPLSKSCNIKSDSLLNGHAIPENDERTKDSASCELWNIIILWAIEIDMI